MLLTENEAGEKWCPHVRIARREIIDNETPAYADGNTTIVAGCNTDALGRLRVPASCRCIASGCAMWRVAHTASRLVVDCGQMLSQVVSEPPRPTSVPTSWEFRAYDEAEDAPARWVEPKSEARTRDRGYCGLAGVPSVAP